MPSLFYIRQFRDREIDWLVKRLEYEVDHTGHSRGGHREYRGDILPLLFTGMYEVVSSELLKNKTLQQTLRNKVRFNEFLENHVKEDPRAGNGRLSRDGAPLFVRIDLRKVGRLAWTILVCSRCIRTCKTLWRSSCMGVHRKR